MKKYLLVATSLIICILSSCSVDSPVSQTDEGVFIYGTYMKNNNDYYILNDTDKKILLKNKVMSDDYLGKRFFVVGKSADAQNSAYDKEMSADMMEESTVYKINIVDSLKQIKELGSSGIDFSSDFSYNHIYFSGKYLNFIFSIISINPNNHTFTYSFDKNKKEYSQNKFTIYIRQKNNNGEAPGSEKKFYPVYSSLDMTEIFNKTDENRITIIINYINLSGIEKEDVYEIRRD